MAQMVSAERAAALSIGFRFGEPTDVEVATVDVARWHFSDPTGSPDEVRFLGQSGLPDYPLGLLSLTDSVEKDPDVVARLAT
jgi:hypothetical protein